MKVSIQIHLLSLKILGSLFTGDVKLKSLSGPVGIYTIVDQVKSQGFETLLYLTAYLSINVAIINLIPVPVFLMVEEYYFLIIEKDK
ncbi:MAG: M50 family metallopeptidase [Clostridium sp.]|nr:MAG: M50 family metallopeptidase [Clostridium sp.]